MGEDDPSSTIRSLDVEAACHSSFVTMHLTARLRPDDGLAPADLIGQIKDKAPAGVIWEQMVPESSEVFLRAGICAQLDRETLQTLLLRLPAVKAVVVE